MRVTTLSEQRNDARQSTIRTAEVMRLRADSVHNMSNEDATRHVTREHLPDRDSVPDGPEIGFKWISKGVVPVLLVSTPAEQDAAISVANRASDKITCHLRLP